MKSNGIFCRAGLCWICFGMVVWYFPWRYGGGPKIPRKVISISSYYGRVDLRVEVHLLRVQLLRSTKPDDLVRNPSFFVICSFPWPHLRSQFKSRRSRLWKTSWRWSSRPLMSSAIKFVFGTIMAIQGGHFGNHLEITVTQPAFKIKALGRYGQYFVRESDNWSSKSAGWRKGDQWKLASCPI